MFHKKAVLKNFAIFTGRHLCWNLFFNKNAGLQGPSFIKKRLEHRCFFANIEKFLRTPILKNICERLLLRFSLELFSIWTNNMGSEEDVFSKTKQNKNRSKTQLYENKTCLFMMFFIILFFSFSPLHVWRHLPYILNKQFWNNLTNEQLILDQWKNYSLILSILYLLRGSLS